MIPTSGFGASALHVAWLATWQRYGSCAKYRACYPEQRIYTYYCPDDADFVDRSFDGYLVGVEHSLRRRIFSLTTPARKSNDQYVPSCRQGDLRVVVDSSVGWRGDFTREVPVVLPGSGPERRQFHYAFFYGSCERCTDKSL